MQRCRKTTSDSCTWCRKCTIGATPSALQASTYIRPSSVGYRFLHSAKYMDTTLNGRPRVRMRFSSWRHTGSLSEHYRQHSVDLFRWHTHTHTKTHTRSARFDGPNVRANIFAVVSLSQLFIFLFNGNTLDSWFHQRNWFLHREMWILAFIFVFNTSRARKCVYLGGRNKWIIRMIQ